MDEKENPEFVNVGMEQPAAAEQRDDVIIKVDGPSGGKGWKITAICALVLVLGLGAGLAYMWMSMNDANKKVDDVQASLDARTAELNKFRQATGVENPDDFVAAGGAVDLAAIYNAFPETDGVSTLFALNEAYIKDTTDGKYQIASFRATQFGADSAQVGSGAAYFYRALPDGAWKYSGFSGQAVPACTDLEEADIAAFKGVLECTK